jgi:hypothetical protein
VAGDGKLGILDFVPKRICGGAASDVWRHTVNLFKFSETWNVRQYPRITNLPVCLESFPTR